MTRWFATFADGSTLGPFRARGRDHAMLQASMTGKRVTELEKRSGPDRTFATFYRSTKYTRRTP